MDTHAAQFVRELLVYDTEKYVTEFFTAQRLQQIGVFYSTEVTNNFKCCRIKSRCPDITKELIRSKPCHVCDTNYQYSKLNYRL